MKYDVILTYRDNQRITVTLDEKEVPKFLECLKTNEPYQQNDGNLFWLPSDQIRYTNILKQPEPPATEKVEEKKEEPVGGGAVMD